MGRFLRNNAVFILFPAVVVAIVFLARFNLGAALSFGEWGEKSILESTLVLAREKVDRVENAISSIDHSFFQIVDPTHMELACERWRAGIKISKLVKAAAIIDDYGDIVQFFHRQNDPSESSKLYEFIQEDIAPLLDKYESFDQHKHHHRLINDQYILFTSLSIEFENQDYTSVLLYDTDEIVNNLFETLIGDVGRDRVINVVDHRREIIFGGNLVSGGEFIVVQRFPTTLYKWHIQLAPRSAALYSDRAQKQRFSQWILVALAFGVIVLGLAMLYMSMVRQRRLNMLKSEFIANTSHELKTPLALIRMFAELLLMGRVKSDEKVKQYHQIILRETERLTALIDNVLDFAKIERGKSAYEFNTEDIAVIVEGAVDIYRHRVEDIGADVEFKAEPDIPLIEIDRDAITLAIINLIDNAVKYAKGTDVVGVEIYVKRNQIHLDVYDRGAGIPSHHLKRIFERFYRYQASDLETRGHRGSGIGLNLVKNIAKGHGGSVTVTSTPGVETRFSVRIPIKNRQYT